MTTPESGLQAQPPPLTPVPAEDDKSDKKRTVLEVAVETILQRETVITFRNRPMHLQRLPYPHFVPLTKERYDRLAYSLLGPVTTGRIRDTYHAVVNTAPDFSHNDHLILFGYLHADNRVPEAETLVWDSRHLAIDTTTPPTHAIWRSPFAPISPQPYRRMPFIMALAGQDEGLYDDIMQSIAPIIMERKPDGVIWWVGDGANGKSTLMDALYKIFPAQFANLTVKRLVDGRDTPSLNGTLANIVRESSEGRVEDTEIYKSIGTHEDFRVHKFHSQDDIGIRGNIHHIFSANQVPAFNDKGHSARRRTFIVPFTQRFQSDPTFEERTFTPEFFGELISEMMRYARILEAQGFKYKWSPITLGAKAEYDADANNAEEYARHLIAEGVVAFDNYRNLYTDYENWTLEHAYPPLGRPGVKRAVKACGFEEKRWRRPNSANPQRTYVLDGVKTSELEAFGLGRPGLYTVPGFTRIEPEEVEIPEMAAEPPPEEATDTDVGDPEPSRPSILMGKW